jgi:hypothetical protein
MAVLSPDIWHFGGGLCQKDDRKFNWICWVEGGVAYPRAAFQFVVSSMGMKHSRDTHMKKEIHVRVGS